MAGIVVVQKLVLHGLPPLSLPTLHKGTPPSALQLVELVQCAVKGPYSCPGAAAGGIEISDKHINVEEVVVLEDTVFRGHGPHMNTLP